MPRSKASRRHHAFLFQGNHDLLGKAFGWEFALAFKSPNRFLTKFRASNRRRAV